MGSALRDKTVLVVGRGSGIARAVTLLARSEGARVVVAGRDKAKLVGAYQDTGDPGISAEVVDVTDDASIAALADGWGLSTMWSQQRRHVRGESGGSAARESATVVRHQGHRSYHAR